MNKFKEYTVCSFKNDDEAIQFLNTKAYDFYSLKSPYKLKFISIFKSTMLKGMNSVERIIRGTFNCDLYLKNINLDLFTKMFPLISGKTMFNLTDKESILRFSRVLEAIRNSNAHIVVSSTNLNTFKEGFEFLENQPVACDKICYAKDGAITLAGLMFIMVSMLNSRYIKSLSGKEWLLGYITCGEYRLDDGASFIEKYSHVNLEVPIRQKQGNDIATSLLGEYIDKFKITPDKYNDILIEIGSSNPTYRLICSISDDNILVKQGSLTKAAYHQDYSLKIKEKDEFIKYANMVPPFTFVDYLYCLGITCFDKKAVKIIEEQLELILKMNKSKFYGDKNLKILQLGSTFADFRLMAEIFSSAIMNITLGLSSLVRVNKHFNLNFSESLAGVLKAINAPEETTSLLIKMRNFASHGYVINDCYIQDDKLVEYSFENVINSLCLLAKHLMNLDDQYQIFAKREIMNSLVRTTLNGKYKIAIKRTSAYIQDPSEYNKGELNRAIAWIKNSGFDTNWFAPLIEILDQNIKTIIVYDKTRNIELYFPGTYASLDEFESYRVNNNLVIAKQIEEPLKTYITLENQ